jgi:hypothetical protein
MKANIRCAKENEKPRLAAGLFRFIFVSSAVLLVFLAALLLTTLLLLAGLLLSTALLAALLLTTLLLLARLLVRILIHFTFLSHMGLKRHFDQSRPWRVTMRGRCICSVHFARLTLKQNVFGTWCGLDVFLVTTGGTDDGTLSTAVVARDTHSYSGADLDIWRLALIATSALLGCIVPKWLCQQPHNVEFCDVAENW